MNRIFKYILLCIPLLFICCTESVKTGLESNPVLDFVQEDDFDDDDAVESSKYRLDVTKKAIALYDSGDFVPFDTIKKQKLDTRDNRADISLKNGANSVMNGNQLHDYLKKRTLFIMTLFTRGDALKIEMVGASGGVISEDGLIFTNYHVINPTHKFDFIAMFAADYDGNVYPITEVLSGSKPDDTAILRIDTKEKKLDFFPLAEQELIGQDVFVMGHPFRLMFYMTEGIIARKFIRGRSKKNKVHITADFGRGSSGGPVINKTGQLVAIVSATNPHYTGSKKSGDLQFTIREAIPVSTVKTFIKE